MRRAVRVAHHSLPAAIAWSGQRDSSRAAADVNREIKEPCGGQLVRLLDRTCSWESNALPLHVPDPSTTIRLQVHLKDDFLVYPKSNSAVLLIKLWVLEETFQANTSWGLVECNLG